MTASPGPPRLLPPFGLLAAWLVMLALHWTLPGPTWLPASWSAVGFVGLAGGLALTVYAAQLFRRKGTPVVPFTPMTALVTDGPFRHTRNPMYLGITAAALGVALLLGTTTPLAVALLFWLWLDRRFVRREEVVMRARFGDAYVAYCRRVRRWL